MKPPESMGIVVSYDVQLNAGITLVTFRKGRVLDVHQDGMAQHVTKVGSKLARVIVAFIPIKREDISSHTETW